MDDGASGVPILTGDGTENFTAEDDRGQRPRPRGAERRPPRHLRIYRLSRRLADIEPGGNHGSGGPATGTMTRGGPAPAGGTPVALASSNTDLAVTCLQSATSSLRGLNA
jgi:hypothetical protein